MKKGDDFCRLRKIFASHTNAHFIFCLHPGCSNTHTNCPQKESYHVFISKYAAYLDFLLLGDPLFDPADLEILLPSTSWL